MLTSTPPVPATGWAFEIDEGVARLRLIDSEGKSSARRRRINKPVKAGTWNHLTFTYDGSRTENGYAFYMNGSRMPTERGAFGNQDSTIAPELKESVKNTLRIAVGATAGGEKGHRRIRSASSVSSIASSAKRKRAWPPHGRPLRRRRQRVRAALGRRERCVEALST